MSPPRPALPRGVLRAVLLAGSLCAGPAQAADTEAARALMGLAEDRQRAQDAARVLDRLAPVTRPDPTESRPAAVAATQADPAAIPVAPRPTAPVDAPDLPRPGRESKVEPPEPRLQAPTAQEQGAPKPPAVVAPAVAVPAPARPGKEPIPTKPVIAELAQPAPFPKPIPPRIDTAPTKPEPAIAAAKPPERETLRPVPTQKPTQPAPAIVATLPPGAEGATARKPEEPDRPRREPPAPVVAARPVEEPAPARPMAGAEVYFGYGSVSLSDEATAALMPLGEDRAGTAVITILGHADALEKDTLDRKLSERRAEAVRRFLVATLGFDPKRLVVRGIGAERPKVKGDLPSPQNRRVEILAAPVGPSALSPSSPARPSPDRSSPDRAR